MYDDLKKDITEKLSRPLKAKSALWGTAVKSVMEAKQASGENITVSWLSEQTGIADKHLFNIIAGRIHDPSSEKLVKIADALGIPFSELAARAADEWEGNFHVSSFTQRGIIQYPQHGFSIQMLSPPAASRRDFFMGIMVISPFRGLTKWKFSQGSMIGVYLESGTLEIGYGTKVRKLHANESVYFDGNVPHKFRNLDSIDARFVLVTHPSIF